MATLRSHTAAIHELYTRGEHVEPPDHQNQQGGPTEEVLPPPPTMAEVLAQIERNQMDQTRIIEAIANNTSPAPATSGGAGAQRP